jgi:tetratricopeptide (TPR) repeat protein
MSRLRRALLLALLLPALPSAASAQVSLIARVAGTVRDEGGKPIAGATIIATNPNQTPTTLTASSDDKGRFAILGLRRGSWTFAISAPGFKTTQVSGNVQTAKPNAPINVTLSRGTPAASGPAPTITVAELQEAIDAAETSASNGDLDSAIKGYRDVVAKVPGLTTGYLRLGGLLEKKGDGGGALEAYQQVLKIEPGDARAVAAVARLSRMPS